MRYDKPEVAVLGLALLAVQGQHKDTTKIADAQFEVTTPNAYEADE
jgi:hypothetical protein